MRVIARVVEIVARIAGGGRDPLERPITATNGWRGTRPHKAQPSFLATISGPLRRHVSEAGRLGQEGWEASREANFRIGWAAPCFPNFTIVDCCLLDLVRLRRGIAEIPSQTMKFGKKCFLSLLPLILC